MTRTQNTITYLRKDGKTITVGVHEPELFGKLDQRESEQSGADETNRKAREDYERAIANANESVSAGRDFDHASIPAVPVCIHVPDDPDLPVGTVAWEPPLLTLLAAAPEQPVPGAVVVPEAHAVHAKLDLIIEILKSIVSGQVPAIVTLKKLL